MEADGGQEAGAVVGADGPADHPIIVDAADGADAAVAIAAAGVDWDDRLSWEDSERFEEDSLCSWLSEPESLIQNWRGWSSTDAAGDNNGAVIVRNHHGNVATGPANADVHGGGAGAVIIPPGTAGGSHRHHHHHSAGGGGGTCGSPDRHHLIGGSNLNYNGGLAAGARANAAEGDVVGGSKIFSLVEMTSREVARSVPFELVERFYPPVPETLQLRVAFWSFPENEQDIRLYSCLANGNVDEFQKGEQLYRNRVVRDVLQIGFHLSGLVYQPAASSDSAGLLSTSVSIGRRETSNGNGPRYGHHHNHWVSSGGGGGGGHGRAHTTSAITSTSPQCFNVAVTLDRRRITSCTCTCQPLRTAAWCSHVVAVCLHRIRQPETVCLRAPVSESLSRLQRDQLQKFAQYLISELPRQILPTAQRLLDDLLSQTAQINTVCGAPDPTAGASINEISWWCLEDSVLHENIRKILVKFCQPSPTVFSDVNYLSSSAPPAATEWQALMRPLRGREPEGLWNLLSIVKEMYKRRDSNSAKLLRIITTECLNCDQVVLWWYHTKLSQSLNGPQLLPSCALLVASNSSSAGVNSGKSSNGSGGGGALGGQANSAQYSCASLLDEIVTLWRLLVLNPSMSPEDRHNFAQELRFYHCRAVERVYQILGGGSTVISAGQQQQQRGGQNQENAGAAGAAGHHGAGHQNGGNNRHHHHNHHHHGGAAGGQGTHHHYHHSTALYVPSGNGKLTWETARFDSQTFPGFLPALEACLIDWMDYPIDGVTYETARGRSPSYGSSCGYLTLKEFGHGASGTSDGAVEKKQGKEEKAMTGTKDTKPKKNGPFDEIDRLYLPEAQVQEDNSGDGAVETAGQERRYSSGRSGQQPKRKTPSDWVEEAFRAVSLKKEELEILTARCESLHAHGYTKEAVELAAELAGRLMRDPPDLMMDVPVIVDWSHVKHASAESGTSKNAGSSNKETMGVGAGNSGGGGGGGSGGGATVSKSGVLGQTTGTRKKKRSGTVLETPTVVQQETIFIHPKAMEISEKACATLAKAMFLFSVLADDAEYRPLAFQIGLWALELPRQAAASKLLEVKMHYQESEIVSMLKQLPLEAAEMETLRQRAHRFRSGVYHRHHHSTSSTVGAVSSSTISTNHSKLAPAVPPLSLAIYVFESLSWPSQSTGNQSTGHHNPTGQQQAAHLRANAYRAPGDEQLAFEAAAAALAMKSSVSEAENPLLCEGIRRLKGDISLTLLLRYKDQQEKLALIMDRLLDQEMHQMYKHHNSNASFYGHYIKSGGLSNATSAAPAAALSGASTSSGVFPTNQPSTTAGASCQPAYHAISGSTNRNEIPSSNVHHDRANAGYAIPPSPFSSQNSTNAAYVQRSLSGASPSSSMACFDEADSDSVQNNMGEVSQLSEALDDMVLFGQDDEEEYDLEDDLSGRGEDDGSPFWTGRDGEAANSGDAPAHSANTKARQEGSISDEVASAVSSSTAMSTSDDSSSSGISTRGGGSGNTLRATSGNQGIAAAAASASASVQGARPYAIISGQENGGNGGQGGNGGGVPAAVVGARGNGRRGGASATGDAGMPKSIDPLNKACYVKLNRHRRYVTPSIPNQPSEAHAHFIMELAKRLLIEAGGSHSTAIFTSQGNGPQANQGHGGGPHRQLHLCAFQIGLYSLGIHNKVTPNWLSRTYSSHVSWISGNAMEIGRTAIRILIDTWENHLTPTEAATLADKASQSRDPGMIQAAAELALSTLPQAHALNPTEIYRALAQCKEQPTTTMLEKACLAVEQAAKDYGVYPEVLFRVAQTWYQLYLDSTAGGQGGGGAAEHHQQQQQQQQALIGHFGDPQQQQQSQQQQHYVGADAYASFPPAMPAHHHNAYGAVKAPPMRPPPPSACPPPPAPLLQQQMAAPYGLQQFVSAAPTGLTYLPLRPPTVTSAASGPPATFAVMHHANGSPYQPRHHSVPVASLHHPPTTQHIPPPQHPPPRQPYLNQAAAMMNVYHHQNPYAAAQLAAAAAAAAAVSRNYVGPIVQHHQQRQMPYRAAQPQLLMPPHSQHSMAEQYHLAQFAAAHGHPQHQLQSAPASERHVDQAGGQSRFLYAAYRVGMLALETLGRRINDDRAFTKYGQNPPYGDDVKWLLKISKRLGLMYVQQFCLVAAQSVPSPFVLWDLASEAAMLFSRSTTSGNLTGPTLTPQNSIPNPAAVFGAGSMGTLDMNAAVTMAAAAATMAAVSSGVASQSMGGHPSAQLYKALMHPHVQPLVQRCLQMFYAAAQQKLSHPRFMPADTEEVCALVKAARTAFLHTPGGNIHFHEFLQSLRRQKACKKDVWNKILSQVNG